MSNSLRKAFAAFAIAVSALPASAQEAPGAHTAQIGFVQVSPEIKVRRLLVQNRRPGGVVLLDNVLWSGNVIDPTDTSDDTEAIRAINDHVAADGRVEAVLLPIADGLTIARKR